MLPAVYTQRALQKMNGAIWKLWLLCCGNDFFWKHENYLGDGMHKIFQKAFAPIFSIRRRRMETCIGRCISIFSSGTQCYLRWLLRTASHPPPSTFLTNLKRNLCLICIFDSEHGGNFRNQFLLSNSVNSKYKKLFQRCYARGFLNMHFQNLSRIVKLSGATNSEHSCSPMRIAGAADSEVECGQRRVIK